MSGSSYHRTISQARDRNLLFSTLVELTYRCNLDCVFCYNDLALSGRPMELAHYRQLFDDLAGLGCLHLVLSGGEPLSHPRFFAIGNAARRLGFVLRLKSNGHALRGALAHRVKDEVDPYVIELSLHGARPETHDRQTRVAGSFERLVANIGELKALGLRIKLNSTLTRWNEDELEGMFALADSLEVPLQFDPEVTKRDDGDASPLALTASASGLGRLFRLQAERAGRTGEEPAVQKQGDDLAGRATSDKYCGAGSSAVAIDPYGNVYPCVQWRRPIGNLHHESIVEIWQGSVGLGRIRETTRRAKRLVEALGPLQPYVGFCPGSAEMQTGDPLVIPAAVTRRAEIGAAAAAELLPLHPTSRGPGRED